VVSENVVLKVYLAIRDWVDRQWRAAGLQFKVLLLPAIIPFLAILMIGRWAILYAIGWGWFGLWNIFVAWRYWIYLKELSRKSDETYDSEGKFHLAQEYHKTESATATADRKQADRSIS